VSRKRLEDLTVQRLEHFPIEGPGDSLWAERGDLDQLALRALIAEPCFARVPTDRAQYEQAGVTSRDEPPIYGGASDELGGVSPCSCQVGQSRLSSGLLSMFWVQAR
jgi:hypothetical protein